MVRTGRQLMTRSGSICRRPQEWKDDYVTREVVEKQQSNDDLPF